MAHLGSYADDVSPSEKLSITSRLFNRWWQQALDPTNVAGLAFSAVAISGIAAGEAVLLTKVRAKREEARERTRERAESRE